LVQRLRRSKSAHFTTMFQQRWAKSIDHIVFNGAGALQRTIHLSLVFVLHVGVTLSYSHS